MRLSRSLRRAVGRIILAGALGNTIGIAANACGRDSDCAVGDRTYRIVLPAGRDPAALIGAIIFVHGYRGTAAGVMDSPSLTGLADELGVAFVAPQAAGPEWNIPGVPSVDAREGVDEIAYFDALAAGLSGRFGVDRSRIVVAGFSSGAMMVWHLACQRGNVFAGYVPMSGTFWAPLPRQCPGGPVNLVHYHGTEDPMVPLGGRPIKDARQGDVREAVAMVARTGGYRPAAAGADNGLDCARQVRQSGEVLELCLFPGKHEMHARHLVRAWKLMAASQP